MKEIQVVGSHQVMTGEDMKIWLLRHGLEEPTDHNAWGALVKHLSGGQIDQGHGSNQFGYYQAKSWAAIADLEI